ncbi:hypothetical protein O181_085494 [Austropuccinia psidii MF-1]|uniref:Uncharacterized protein n=1 Tax=Austropuccinia psidii MF-1 TaxID=1389203 RepID=A0A9Q3FVD8_9BASI|nr:hypothetical protein [Austropuccinia psidii MF-1]
MKTTSIHMLRWKIAVQEYRGNMTIIYKEGKRHTNEDGLIKWPLDNFISNPAYDPEAPEFGTPESDSTEPEGKETPKLGIISSELHNEAFGSVPKTYAKHKHCSIMLQLLQQKYRSPEVESKLEVPWLRDYKDNKFLLIDALLYHKEKHTSALTVIDRDHISLILQAWYDCPFMRHMSKDRTKKRVESPAWWAQWEQEFSGYINTC